MGETLTTLDPVTQQHLVKRTVLPGDFRRAICVPAQDPKCPLWCTWEGGQLGAGCSGCFTLCWIHDGDRTLESSVWELSTGGPLGVLGICWEKTAHTHVMCQGGWGGSNVGGEVIKGGFHRPVVLDTTREAMKNKQPCKKMCHWWTSEAPMC